MRVSYSLQSRSVSEVMCRCWFMELWKVAHELIHYSVVRGLLEKYPTFGREKETGLLGALDT